MRVMDRDHSVLVDPRGPLWELEVGVRDASAAASPPPPTSMMSGHLQRKRGCAGPRPGEYTTLVIPTPSHASAKR
jgi:hypothetical protein